MNPFTERMGLCPRPSRRPQEATVIVTRLPFQPVPSHTFQTPLKLCKCSAPRMSCMLKLAVMANSLPAVSMHITPELLNFSRKSTLNVPKQEKEVFPSENKGVQWKVRSQGAQRGCRGRPLQEHRGGAL